MTLHCDLAEMEAEGKLCSQKRLKSGALWIISAEEVKRDLPWTTSMGEIRNRVVLACFLAEHGKVHPPSGMNITRAIGQKQHP